MAGARPSKDDDALITEIREHFTYDSDQWRPIRDEGAEDMRFVAGDPWDPQERKQREDAGRVCLSLDELSQYVNQVINDIRLNKRAIEVTPLGAGATDDTAEARANLIRQIEYRSNAQQAYTTMFENAVQRSYGFLRVKPAYRSETSLDQELLIEPIVNPDLVTPDADALTPDGGDMKRCFIRESWDVTDFQRAFPKARRQSFTADDAVDAPDWYDGQRKLWLAEYWKVKKTPDDLLLIQTPQGGTDTVFASDLPEDAPPPTILKSREAQRSTVWQYLTNGFEILKADPYCPARQAANGTWLKAAQSIPIVCCFGKVLYVNLDGTGSKRVILSMIRLAREPQMLYAYVRTCEAETVGQIPKAPYRAYRGQLNALEKEAIARSLHEPVAVLEFGATSEATGNKILPPIDRNTPDLELGGLEALAESSRRAIQAAIGSSPLPSSAQRRTDKSGVALKQIEDTAQRGSYHFVDHYEDSIKRTGVLLNEAIPHYYDAAADVTVRTPAGEPQQQRVNDPSHPESVNLTDGDHDITLSTGPSSDSEREAASDFADNLAQNPAVSVPLLPLIIKLKNLGPIGDEMIKVAKALLPPQIAAVYQDPTEQAPQIPPQVQQQMQQLQAENQQLHQAVAIDQAKGQIQIQIAQLDNATKVKIAELQTQAQLVITQQKINADQAEASIEAETKRIAAALDEKVGTAKILAGQVVQAVAHVQDVTTQTLEHAHERAMAAQSAVQASQAADQGHQQALEQQAAQPTQEAGDSE